MAEDNLESKKLVIIGDGACGKTCLLEVFEKGVFPEKYLPTVFHTSKKKIPHPTKPGEEAELQLWDTAGQEAFEEARKTCYPGTEILLIGFSHGEPDSLQNVEAVWQKETKLDDLKTAPVLLVGLKADLIDDEATKELLAQRDKAPVTESEAQEMATKIGAQGYFKTSAKENQGVKELFDEAARLAWDYTPTPPPTNGCPCPCM